MTETSRRNLLQGVAAAGVALPLVAACGSESGTPGTSGGGSGTPGGSSATPDVIKTADIPVGGGKIFEAEKLVVTQPKAGEFKAFSSICTHAGCPVTQISDGTIDCPCHGSQYSIEDGSVQGGPAPRPLAAKTVTVNGDTLTIS